MPHLEHLEKGSERLRWDRDVLVVLSTVQRGDRLQVWPFDNLGTWLVEAPGSIAYVVGRFEGIASGMAAAKRWSG